MNLFNELSEVERKAVAVLIGFENESAGFRNNLREIPAFNRDFTIGEAARMYLLHVFKNKLGGMDA